MEKKNLIEFIENGYKSENILGFVNFIRINFNWKCLYNLLVVYWRLSMATNEYI